MAIYTRGVFRHRLVFEGIGSLTNFCGIIFDPDMLESQSRAQKTRRIA